MQRLNYLTRKQLCCYSLLTHWLLLGVTTSVLSRLVHSQLAKSFSSNTTGYFKKSCLLLVHDDFNQCLCSIPCLRRWLRMWLLPVSWFLVHLQACRALMILSLLVGLASIVVSVLGLKCTKIGRTSERVKDQMALSGGILFILSGMWPGTEMLCPPNGFIVHNCWTCVRCSSYWWWEHFFAFTWTSVLKNISVLWWFRALHDTNTEPDE